MTWKRLSSCVLAIGLPVAGALLNPAGIGVAFAQAKAGPQAPTEAARVDAGAYAVEPNHTQVLFSVLHLGFSTYYGQFSGVSGTLNLDPKAPSKSTFEIHVPVKSVSTTSDKLTGELKSSAWLDAAAYPEIVFKSSKVSPVGHGYATITGTLTLHGVTRPVTLRAKLVGAGINPLDKKYTVGFDVTGSIKRSEFGVKTYVPLISDAVTLTISGVFEKQG